MNPFIKRLGSKRRYLKHIVPLVPHDFDTYIEPFVGTGSLFLHLRPPNWIINDIDKDIINLWETVRSPSSIIHETIEHFAHTFLPLDRNARLMMCRDLTGKFQQMDYTPQRAALFVILTYTVFMGMLVRNNRFYFRGLDLSLNKPPVYFVSDKYRRNMDDVSAFTQSTKGQILNEDYKKILAKAIQEDFVFLDPPYTENIDYDFDYNQCLNNTNKLSPIHFLQELKEQVDELHKRDVRFLMTQADTPEVEKLFKNYKMKKFQVYRRRSKSYRNEIIIYN